jgi:hypothetical protein
MKKSQEALRTVTRRMGKEEVEGRGRFHNHPAAATIRQQENEHKGKSEQLRVVKKERQRATRTRMWQEERRSGCLFGFRPSSSRK